MITIRNYRGRELCEPCIYRIANRAMRPKDVLNKHRPRLGTLPAGYFLGDKL